jgi:hypothetical protein
MGNHQNGNGHTPPPSVRTEIIVIVITIVVVILLVWGMFSFPDIINWMIDGGGVQPTPQVFP